MSLLCILDQPQQQGIQWGDTGRGLYGDHQRPEHQGSRTPRCSEADQSCYRQTASDTMSLFSILDQPTQQCVQWGETGQGLNGQSTKGLEHQDAQKLIKAATGDLLLTPCLFSILDQPQQQGIQWGDTGGGLCWDNQWPEHQGSRTPRCSEADQGCHRWTTSATPQVCFGLDYLLWLLLSWLTLASKNFTTILFSSRKNPAYNIL